jgi:RNA polymerase sigma-B factor
MQEGLLTLNQAMERLSAQLGHSPSPQQLASELGVTVEDVLEAVEAGAAYNTIPLDTPLRSQDGEALTVAGSLGHNDDRFEVVEDRAAVERALRALPARERSIIYLHFAESLTQVEIAKRAGISQMHVSRLIRRALETMRVVVAGPQSGS